MFKVGERVPKVEAILFDYGNVLLLDPFPDIINNNVRKFNDILRKFDCIVSDNQLISSWNKANRDVHYPFISHFYQEMPIVLRALEYLGSCTQLDEMARSMLSLYRRLFIEFLSETVSKHKLVEVLSKLKTMGIKLGVISNERKEALSLALRYLCIDEIFDLVLSSEEIGVEKPDLTIFKFALNRLRLEPKYVAYVGDEPVRDIAPAKSLGMVAILFLPERAESTPWRNYTTCQAQPDIIITSLEELLSLT